MIAGTSLLVSCGGSGSKTETEKTETAVVYTCPMHPEVEQSEPGSCPDCGMDLVKKGEAKKSDHMDSDHMNSDHIDGEHMDSDHMDSEHED